MRGRYAACAVAVSAPLGRTAWDPAKHKARRRRSSRSDMGKRPVGHLCDGAEELAHVTAGRNMRRLVRWGGAGYSPGVGRDLGAGTVPVLHTVTKAGQKD